MKMLHFVDAATTDETFVSSENIRMIQVTDANTVKVHIDGRSFEQTADVRLDQIVLTATAKSEVVALRLAEHMVATNIGGSNVLTVKAATTPFTEVSTVAFTVGA